MTKQIPIVCPGHTRPLAELQFCSQQQQQQQLPSTSGDDTIFLLSACHDRIPMVRNGISGDWIGSLIGHKGAVWCCRMDSTCNLIGTASGDYTCKVWDSITGNCLYTFYDGQHIMKSCDFNYNSTLFATGGHDGIVRIYNLIEQEVLYNNYMNQPKTSSTTTSSNSNSNTNNKNSKNKKNQTEETSTSPAMVNVKPLEIIVQPIIGTTSAATSNNNTKIIISKISWYNDTIIIVGCSDGTIRLYDITQYINDTNATTNSAPTQLVLDPIHIIQTKDPKKEIRDMELKTISLVSTEANEQQHQQKQVWLSCAAGNTIYIYHIVTDNTNNSTIKDIQLLYQYTVPKINFDNEGGLSIHPNGTKCIVGGSDLYVYIYEMNTKTKTFHEIECCKGHHGPIRCLRYSPNGTTFASGSEDGTIRLWQGL